MLSGEIISMLDALGIAISSMMVVFSVLLTLFVAVKLFPVIFKEKQAVAVPDASFTPEDDDDDELAAVISAAIQAYTEAEPCVFAGNPFARNCRH